MYFEIEGNPYNLNKLTDSEEYLKNIPSDIELYENSSREAGSSKTVIYCFKQHHQPNKNKNIHCRYIFRFMWHCYVLLKNLGSKLLSLATNFVTFFFGLIAQAQQALKILELRNHMRINYRQKLEEVQVVLDYLQINMAITS
ncbi:hypothetical protein EDC94DRAFT_652948 [Helicostylum pulchrum]|nr:hypothetical protein EDC94DRAFT_652948 [Helicostylum pulchrum]